MKLAFILMAALACFADDRTCYAGDRLVGDVYTRHSSACQLATGGCEPWKQPHRLSWQHDLSDTLSTDAGVGTNSYGNLSANLGLLWQPVKLGFLRGGVFAALASGYTCEQLRTCVLAGGLVATAELDRAVLQAVYVPAIKRGGYLGRAATCRIVVLTICANEGVAGMRPIGTA